VFSLEAVRVYRRAHESLIADAAAAAAACGVSVIPARSVREAVAEADIVVTATGLTNDVPIVERAWISPGTVVCGLGSYQEIDSALILQADKLIVDSWDACSQRGQFAPLVKAGRLYRSEIYAELPDLATGGRPGRSADHEVIVASLIGLGVLDLAISGNIVETAQRRGIGRRVAIDV
jgi:ornithine cyclodeaminase/alanine dehydrogenase-like protein (mu-crystallin family)